MNPLVSFVIPVYNAGKFVAETINSVLTCGYEPVEIILVDDGSTDNSLEICQSFKKQSDNILLIQHPGGVNKGTSTTRLAGIQEAKGEFIYFLDADDIILNGILSQYICVFSKNADVIMVHGEIEVINTPDCPQNFEKDFIIGFSDKKYHLEDEPYYLKSDRICTSTVCVRKEAIKNINFKYHQVFHLGEDWLLWTLLAQKGYFYYFAQTVIKYRIHNNSATIIAHQKGQNYLKYNLMEYYLCLMAKTNDSALREKVKDNLFDLVNEIYRSYNEEIVSESCEQIGFDQIIPSNKQISTLKEKIYNLERGYGYYFYFLYLIKKFIWKFFFRKRTSSLTK